MLVFLLFFCKLGVWLLVCLTFTVFYVFLIFFFSICGFLPWSFVFAFADVVSYVFVRWSFKPTNPTQTNPTNLSLRDGRMFKVPAAQGVTMPSWVNFSRDSTGDRPPVGFWSRLGGKGDVGFWRHSKQIVFLFFCCIFAMFFCFCLT